MDDDFNTAGAIAAIFDLIRFCNKTLDEGDREKECLQKMREAVVEMGEVLGLKLEGRRTMDDGREIEKLIKERETARKAKNFARADQIRVELQKQGIEIEDTPYGTKWSKNA
jgi:cysteinyl-tRNA synthetase